MIPISEIFRERLREARRHKEWTQQDLSEALAAMGVRLESTAINRLERGSRGVSLDEAFALAAALGTSPLFLLMPSDMSTVVELAPGLGVSAEIVRKWIQGRRVLRATQSDTPLTSSPVSEVSDTSAAVTDLTDVTAPGTSETPSETEWTRQAIAALGATTNVRTAASVLGVGERLAYESIKRGDWPTRVLRLGTRILIPTNDLIKLLYGPEAK